MVINLLTLILSIFFVFFWFKWKSQKRLKGEKDFIYNYTKITYKFLNINIDKKYFEINYNWKLKSEPKKASGSKSSSWYSGIVEGSSKVISGDFGSKGLKVLSWGIGIGVLWGGGGGGGGIKPLYCGGGWGT